MLASDIQTSLPLLNRRTNALVAGRLLTHQYPGGLVVADDDGTPLASISSADVLSLMVPVDARELGEDAWPRVAERTIGDLVENEDIVLGELLHVTADDDLLELAANMVAAGAQMAIVDDGLDRPRFVSLPAVLDAILALCGDARDLD
jgi:hypothetical protein